MNNFENYGLPSPLFLSLLVVLVFLEDPECQLDQAHLTSHLFPVVPIKNQCNIPYFI